MEEKSKTKRRAPSTLAICLACVIVTALICGGLILFKKFLKVKPKSGSTTYTVRSETYENIIDISGTVSAAKEQKLQALSSGTVMSVSVKQGDVVKKGDIILQLDDTTEKYNLAKHDYDMQTTRISGSAMQYSLMQTQREALVQKIAERKVTATFDGIIAAISVSAGDSLEAKDSIGTLVDKSYLVADVEVAETDVKKLAVGQPVEFDFSAYDGTVQGYVVSWPAIGEVTSRGATIVKARVRIDKYPEEILPNFSFSGKIKISPDETFLLVSRYAIGREGGQTFVVLAQGGQKVNVTVEPYSSEYMKVTAGLSGGEVLVAQSEPKASGWNKQSGMMGGGSRTNAAKGGAMGGMGGMGTPPRR